MSRARTIADLAGITSSIGELNILDAVTTTSAELNLLDMSTATGASSSTFLRGDGSWQTAGSTSASDLTSGTLPMARLTGTLPALDGSLLTNLPAGGVAGISSSADATAITINSSEQVGINNTNPSNPLDVSGIVRANATGNQFQIGDLKWYGAVNAGNTNNAFSPGGGKRCGIVESLGTENNRNSGYRMYTMCNNNFNGLSLSEIRNITQGNGYGNGYLNTGSGYVRYVSHSSWHNNAYVKMTTIIGD